MPDDEGIPTLETLQPLAAFCNQHGFEEFGEYCTNTDVQACLTELTKWILKERPSDPRQFLLEKYRDMYPLEKFAAQNEHDTEINVEQLIRLFEATRNITHEIVPAESINICIRESVRLLQCDRVSIFIYDKKIKMLILSASNLSKPIRVNPGQGIAGHVFKTGETVNIPDCYQDSRFDPSFDKLTGYVTKSMLVKPIHDYEGNVMGVLQAINKEDGNTTIFNKADEIVIQNFMQLVGITLRNVEVYKDAIAHCKRAQGMISMLNSLPKNLGSQSMILTITMYAAQLVQSDQCAVYLNEEQKGTLWSVSSASSKDVRVPNNRGIAGACVMSKETLLIEDVSKDQRWTKSEDLCISSKDATTAEKCVTMLAIPLIPPNEERCLGVVVLQNKREFDGEIAVFNEEDAQIMETFAKIVAERLKDSTLLQEQAPRMTEAGRIFGNKSPPQHKKDGTQGRSSLGASDGITGSGTLGQRTSRVHHRKPDAAIREGEEDEAEAEMGHVASIRKSGRLSLKTVNNVPDSAIPQNSPLGQVQAELTARKSAEASSRKSAIGIVNLGKMGDGVVGTTSMGASAVGSPTGTNGGTTDAEGTTVTPIASKVQPASKAQPEEVAKDGEKTGEKEEPKA